MVEFTSDDPLRYKPRYNCMNETIVYINVAIELCSTAFSLAGLISIHAFANAPRAQSRTLSACFIANIVMALSDAAASLNYGVPGQASGMIAWGGTALTFISCGVLNTTVAYFIASRIEITPPPERFRDRTRFRVG